MSSFRWNIEILHFESTAEFLRSSFFKEMLLPDLVNQLKKWRSSGEDQKISFHEFWVAEQARRGRVRETKEMAFQDLMWTDRGLKLIEKLEDMIF